MRIYRFGNDYSFHRKQQTNNNVVKSPENYVINPIQEGGEGDISESTAEEDSTINNGQQVSTEQQQKKPNKKKHSASSKECDIQ